MFRIPLVNAKFLISVGVLSTRICICQCPITSKLERVNSTPINCHRSRVSRFKLLFPMRMRIGGVCTYLKDPTAESSSGKRVRCARDKLHV